MTSNKPPFRLAVIDRENLAEAFRSKVPDHAQVLPRASVLELLNDTKTGAYAGLVVNVAAAGPFLGDLLRWTEATMSRRVPTLVVASGGPEDTAAARLLTGRSHVSWMAAERPEQVIQDWIHLAVEVEAIRFAILEHEAVARRLREARLQLFQGGNFASPPPLGPPCGPPLPTCMEEVLQLRDARSLFAKAHITAAVGQYGSFKEASNALGVSYTSLWRRMR